VLTTERDDFSFGLMGFVLCIMAGVAALLHAWMSLLWGLGLVIGVLLFGYDSLHDECLWGMRLWYYYDWQSLCMGGWLGTKQESSALIDVKGMGFRWGMLLSFLSH
jgi:hypothetical protein